MDPFTLITGGLGAVLGIAGGIGGAFTAQKEAGVASEEAQVSGKITGLQGQENVQRQLAMQISARRSMVENARQTQLAQAKDVSAATNQGAQFGSGLAGGVAGAAAVGAYNQQGISQNLSIGNQIFDYQSQITQDQVRMSQLQSQQASLQGQAAMWGALSSIGGSLLGAAGPSGKLLGNFFGNSSDPTINQGISTGPSPDFPYA